MDHDHDSLDTSNRLGPSLRRAVTRAVVVLLVASGVYYAERQGWLKNERPLEQPRAEAPSATRENPATDAAPDEPTKSTPSDESAETSSPVSRSLPAPKVGPDERSWLVIRNQTIRDEQGNIVYRGDVDLRPTFDRIERGDKASHRNDGTVFQNREGRLPRKATGYYREYVHPTPKLSGPGPQRLVIGSGQEMYYTPDHYRTFRALK